jgi:hypothetical protein
MPTFLKKMHMVDTDLIHPLPVNSEEPSSNTLIEKADVENAAFSQSVHDHAIALCVASATRVTTGDGGSLTSATDKALCIGLHYAYVLQIETRETLENKLLSFRACAQQIVNKVDYFKSSRTFYHRSICTVIYVCSACVFFLICSS